MVWPTSGSSSGTSRGRGTRSGSSARKVRTGPGAGLGGLEAHRHPAHARAPHPAGPVLGVHDVHARAPTPRPGDGGDGLGRPRERARRSAGVVVLREQVLLDPVRQPGDADAEQADAAGGVHLGEQGPGQPGDDPGVVGRRRQRAGAGVGGEVVQPDLDGDRAAGQPGLAQPLGHLPGLPVDQPLEQPPVDEVGVVGVLDADRLGLPLGDHRAVVVGAGQPVERGAVRLADAAGPARPRRPSPARATVCTPTRRSRSAVAGPTPGMTPTLIGRSRSCSVPGGTTTRPSGLSRSLAILATSLEEAMPTEPQSPPVTSRTSSLSRRATAVTPATDDVGATSAAARSTNASSSESGSTSGDSSRSSAITAPAGRRGRRRTGR